MLTLKKIAFLNAFTGFFWTCNPLFIALATFGVYTMIAGGTLTSDKVREDVLQIASNLINIFDLDFRLSCTLQLAAVPHDDVSIGYHLGC